FCSSRRHHKSTISMYYGSCSCISITCSVKRHIRRMCRAAACCCSHHPFVGLGSAEQHHFRNSIVFKILFVRQGYGHLRCPESKRTCPEAFSCKRTAISSYPEIINRTFL